MKCNGFNSTLLAFGEDGVTSNRSRVTISDMRAPANDSKISGGDTFRHELEQLSLESMSYCSRFDDCSAQKCPLDILIASRHEAEGDPRCGMAKPTRHKYWQSMPARLKEKLPFQGFLEAEYNRKIAARERWESLTEYERNEVRERLKGGIRA